MRMLVCQTPVRLSMGGGGTDVAAYYEKFGGFWTSAAINQFVYLTVNVRNDNNYVIKYSNVSERVASIQEIQHQYFQTALKLLDFDQWQHPLFRTRGLEINIISDVQTKSGLGVSGAMTVGLLQILHTLRGEGSMSMSHLAEEAYQIEHDLVGSTSTGKQDQYIAAYGGITSFAVDPSGQVTVSPLQLSRHTISELEDNIVLFGTRLERKMTAQEALAKVTAQIPQDSLVTAGKSVGKPSNQQENYLSTIKDIGLAQRDALLHEQPDKFGQLLHDHWEVKKQYSGAADPAIERAYTMARQAGAFGGKVIGASTQGAYMMFYSPAGKDKLRAIMNDLGMVEIPWSFEFNGSRIVHVH